MRIQWELDEALISTAWWGVTLTVVWALSCRRKPIAINGILCITSLFSLIVVAYRLNKRISQLPWLFFERIFDGSYRRICLLLFWSSCVIASFGLCGFAYVNGMRTTTAHRKFFHLTISLIAISGLHYDPIFLQLAANIVLMAFILLEMLRALHVPPWSVPLTRWLAGFFDGQDDTYLILTPILLVIGIFLPLFLFPFDRATFTPRPWHFAGVISVGVGDSCAAIFGSLFGKTRWRWSDRKTVEGSLAMFIGQAVAQYALNIPFSWATVIANAASTLVESILTWGDNLAVPFVSTVLTRYLS